MKQEYPYNFVAAFIGRRANIVPGPPEDVIKGIEHVIALVPEPDRSIVLSIYRDGQTIDETARSFGLDHKECVQHVQKAIRRLSRSDALPYIIKGYEGCLKAQEARRDEILRELADNEAKAGTVAEKAAEMIQPSAEVSLRNESIFTERETLRGGHLNEIELYDYVRQHAQGYDVNALAEKGIETLGDLCSLTEEELFEIDGVSMDAAENIVIGLQKLYGLRLPKEHSDPFGPIAGYLNERTRSILRRSGIQSLPELCRWSRHELKMLPGIGTATAAQLDRMLNKVGLKLKSDVKDTEFLKQKSFREWVLTSSSHHIQQGPVNLSDISVQ